GARVQRAGLVVEQETVAADGAAARIVGSGNEAVEGAAEPGPVQRLAGATGAATVAAARTCAAGREQSGKQRRPQGPGPAHRPAARASGAGAQSGVIVRATHRCLRARWR